MKYYSKEKEDFVCESMYECLTRNNISHGDVPALQYFEKSISFKQMVALIDEIASVFQVFGVKKRDKVIVLGLNTPEIICSIYAINKLGAVACMEYITLSEENLKKITLDYAARYAVVIDQVFDKYQKTLYDAGIKNIFLARGYSSMPFPMNVIAKGKTKVTSKSNNTVDIHKAIKTKGNRRTNIESQPDDIAIILSTSGTTGIPKRAELTNNAINALAYQCRYIDIELKVGTTMLTPAPPFLAFGISLTTHMPLCNGTCLILSISPDPDFVAKQFIKYRPNLFMGGHVFLDKLMSLKTVQKMDLSFVSAIELGGENISAEYAIKVDSFFKDHRYKGNIFVGYGMTELAACSTTEQVCANRVGTVGIPLIDVNMKIQNTDNGNELGYNEVGEILICSPCMMQGYYNNEEATKEMIEIDNNGNKWIHSGDLGKIDEDGFITVVGRIKRIELTIDPVSNAQCKLYPDYIEHLMKKCDLVEECAVIAVADEARLHIPIAFVKLKNDETSTEALKCYMEENAEPYNVPTSYHVVHELPIRPNGKIDYRELENTYIN